MFGGNNAHKTGYVICLLGSKFDREVKVASKSSLMYRSAASSSNMKRISSASFGFLVFSKASRASWEWKSSFGSIYVRVSAKIVVAIELMTGPAGVLRQS